MVHIAPKVYFLVRIGTVQEHVLFQFVVFTIFIKPSQDLSHTLGSLLEPCMAARIYVVGFWNLKLNLLFSLYGWVGWQMSLLRCKRIIFESSRDRYGCVGGQNIQQSCHLGSWISTCCRLRSYGRVEIQPCHVYFEHPPQLDCRPVPPAAPNTIPTKSTCVA